MIKNFTIGFKNILKPWKIRKKYSNKAYEKFQGLNQMK